jgi:flagellar assembly protein FliH
MRAVPFEVDRSGEEELRTVEKQQAYERGYREGERVCREMGERTVETTAKRYETAVADLINAHAEMKSAMETETVELALEIARKVIQREVSMDPDLVSALVLVALRRIQSQKAVTLRVSRHDFSRIHDAVTSVNSSITVVEDSSFERGDFMMDTGQTHLDGRLQSQVETLGRAMLAV